MAEVVWPEALVDRAWEVCCCVMDLRACKALEQKARRGTGTEQLVEVASCACDSSEHAHARDSVAVYCFKKHNNDRIGDQLRQALSRKFFLEDHLAAVFEKAAEVFNAVVARKEAAGEPVFQSNADKAGLQAACLKLSIESHLLRHLASQRVAAEQQEVKDGGKLAYPQSYKLMFPKSPYLALASVPSAAMDSLMTRKYAVVPQWMSEIDRSASGQIARDLEWLDMHSLFEAQASITPHPIRTDHALWLSTSEITPDLTGLAALSLRLTSLPFEMNAKTQGKICVSPCERASSALPPDQQLPAPVFVQS